MCGRIVVSRYGADLSQMRNYANQIMRNLASFRASYNIAPGGSIPGVYRQKKEQDKNKNIDTLISNPNSDIIIESMKWGIDTGRIDSLLFNSRSDTINLYPFYKKYKRCIIIIDGYFIFRNKKIREMLNLKIYKEVEDDVRLSRLIVREEKYLHNNFEAYEIYFGIYERFYKTSYDEYIAANKKVANILLPDYNVTEDDRVEVDETLEFLTSNLNNLYKSE